MPCKDPRLGWNGWWCDRSHIQDGDSIVEFKRVVITGVNETVK